MSIRNGFRWATKPPLGSGLDLSLPTARGLLLRPLLNEGAGKLVAGSAPVMKGGALSGSPTPTWTAGKFGPALSFDGSNSYVIGQGVKLNGLTAASIAVWFRTTTLQLAYPFSLPGESSGTNGFDFQFETTPSIVANLVTSTGIWTPTVTPSYADGAWHHLAATWDGYTATLYYDGLFGVSQASVFATPGTITQANNPAGEWNLGRFGTAGLFFAGSLDLPVVANWCWGAGDVAEMVRRPFSDVLSPPVRRFFAPPPFSPGAAGLVSSGPGGIAVSAAEATNATGTPTHQWERSTASATSGFGALTGATSLTLNDSTAALSTSYWYRLAYTDPATGTTVRSAAVGPLQRYTGGAIGGLVGRRGIVTGGMI